jgi:hypothetical protein
MHIEARVVPGEEPLRRELRDSAFPEEHREDLLPEEVFRLFSICLPRKECEIPVGEEASVGHDGMSVRVEVQRISGRVYTYHGTAHGAFLLHSGRIEVVDGFIRTGAEASQEVAIIPEGAAQELWNGKG